MSGSGLGPSDYGVLTFSPRPSSTGGEPTDLSDGSGVTFDAKGSNGWIDVHTIDTDPPFCKCSGSDCYIGYRYRLPLTDTWATYIVSWEQLTLPMFVVDQQKLDPKNIVAINFGGIGETFDVSIDNIRVAHDVPIDSGSGNQ